MEPRTIFIVSCIAALGLGLIVGGLIGHFATVKKTDVAQVVEKQSSHTANKNFLIQKTSAAEIEKNLEFLSSKPHLAGTEENNQIGDWIERKWKEYNFQTYRESYDVLLSYPGDKNNRNKAQILDTDGSVIFTCQTEERVLDPVQNSTEAVPPFNAYAKSGTVESSTVYYVNYCRLEDFEFITKNYENLSFNNSIVICRYGKIFRGNKVKLAEERGAVGVIIYNDPLDYAPSGLSNATYEDTFPNGPYLPPSGAQRGSLFGALSGDPLTPGFPSKEYTNRLEDFEMREDNILPGIPSQPMGYGDAEHFLRQLSDITDSDEVPADLAGEIKGIRYKIGGTLPNQRKIKIINNNTEKRANITNIFGVIRGSVDPDRYVLVGNHYDAWMFGATDALSGTTVLQESSRVLSLLLKTGWQPRRTIIFCAWDAEEYGITGSFEWLEDVGVVMRQRAVAYVNIDVALSDTEMFVANGSPLMHNLLYETAKTIPHPDPKFSSLYEEWRDVTGDKSDPNSKPKISDLASGSDHTGFYHTNGITSADISYRRINFNDWYPLYHTTYETFKDVKLFIDPDFTYHQAVSRYVTELLRSLSDSVIIPFVTRDYAVRLKEIFHSLKQEVSTELAKKNLSLDYLERAIVKFLTITEEFDSYVATADHSDVPLIRSLNDQIFLLERAFLYPLGVLDRSIIKHVVFAPSASNAYGSSAFSGIGDALYQVKDDDDRLGWNCVKEELNKAIHVVECACRFLQNGDRSRYW